MSKVYPLLSLTLGTTSAVAEGTTFLPVKRSRERTISPPCGSPQL